MILIFIPVIFLEVNREKKLYLILYFCYEFCLSISA
jgi:hypothetical protein